MQVEDAVAVCLDHALEALGKDVPLQMTVGEAICDAIIFLKQDEFRRLEDKSGDELRNTYRPFV